MEIQKATGIVLYSRGMGEADVWSRILTREYGKRAFIFKGIKKSTTRSRAVTEAGTALELQYYYHDDREFQVVNEFRITAHHIEIRGDLDRILHLYFLLEVSDKTTASADPAPRVYDLLAAALDALTRTGHAKALSLFFTLHLLRLHGVMPDFSRCRVCGRTDFGPFMADPGDLLPVCASCAGPRAGNSIAMDPSDRRFISLALRHKFSEMPLGQFTDEGTMRLLFYFALFIEHYFHIEIKSKSMLFSGR